MKQVERKIGDFTPLGLSPKAVVWGFRVKVRFRNKLESFVRCEAQLWPDCGGPSNTFLPPHDVQGGKATQTYSFWGVGLNSDNSPLLTTYSDS